MSLAVIFFLPRGGQRYFHRFSKIKTHAQFSKNRYQNFLRRTDKISPYGRKFFVRDSHSNPALLACARCINPDAAGLKLLTAYNLKARQAVNRHYSVNCCWRI
ncbi:hypothetical protein BEL04_16760 [Mucilaginibacter sp. PPCGB 2223]|nr:hypothetical protein BEL04_16760 [Mucilaginibacter sp. PPCGB 2223]